MNFKQKNKGIYVNLLFNYGSRQEINDAIKKIIIKKPHDLREYFYVHSCDLIWLFTGGEKRLSNFMLWQSAILNYIFKILWLTLRYHLNVALDNFFTEKEIGK